MGRTMEMEGAVRRSAKLAVLKPALVRQSRSEKRHALLYDFA
jgi:hypothetical protein